MYYPLELLAREYLAMLQERANEGRTIVERFWELRGLAETLPDIERWKLGNVPDNLLVTEFEELPLVTVEAVALDPDATRKATATVLTNIYTLSDDVEKAGIINLRWAQAIGTILQEYAPEGCEIKNVGPVGLVTTETVFDSMAGYLKKATCKVTMTVMEKV